MPRFAVVCRDQLTGVRPSPSVDGGVVGDEGPSRSHQPGQPVVAGGWPDPHLLDVGLGDAAGCLAEAVELWRGPPLADVGDGARAEAARLGEARLERWSATSRPASSAGIVVS
jgi:hypothetical protein